MIFLVLLHRVCAMLKWWSALAHFTLKALKCKTKHRVAFIMKPQIKQREFVWSGCREIHHLFLWCISAKVTAQGVFTVVLNCTCYYYSHRGCRQNNLDWNLKDYRCQIYNFTRTGNFIFNEKSDFWEPRLYMQCCTVIGSSTLLIYGTQRNMHDTDLPLDKANK